MKIWARIELVSIHSDLVTIFCYGLSNFWCLGHKLEVTTNILGWWQAQTGATVAHMYSITGSVRIFNEKSQLFKMSYEPVDIWTIQKYQSKDIIRCEWHVQRSLKCPFVVINLIYQIDYRLSVTRI